MSTGEMLERTAEASPVVKARVAGVFWLMSILTAAFGMSVGRRLVVSGDAAATATNILAHESLFRLSFVADLIAGLCYVGVTVLLYHLLKPVSSSLSLLAAFFGLGGVAIGGPYFLIRLAPLVLLRGDPYLSGFSTSQWQAMALVSLKVHMLGFAISMVFFGLQCFLMGYLIVRSAFLPRILGVLLAIAGLGYVTSSFATFLSPPFGTQLWPFILPTGVVGEGSLTLWLLVTGVNEQRWKEQASAAGTSIRT